MQALWSFLFVVILTTVTAENLPCAPRDFDHGSVVCVCNATYCDTFGPVEVPEDGEFYQVVSSRDGERFNATSGSLVDELTGVFFMTADSVVILRKKLETCDFFSS